MWNKVLSVLSFLIAFLLIDTSSNFPLQFLTFLYLSICSTRLFVLYFVFHLLLLIFLILCSTFRSSSSPSISCSTFSSSLTYGPPSPPLNRLLYRFSLCSSFSISCCSLSFTLWFYLLSFFPFCPTFSSFSFCSTFLLPTTPFSPSINLLLHLVSHNLPFSSSPSACNSFTFYSTINLLFPIYPFYPFLLLHYLLIYHLFFLTFLLFLTFRFTSPHSSFIGLLHLFPLLLLYLDCSTFSLSFSPRFHPFLLLSSLSQVLLLLIVVYLLFFFTFYSPFFSLILLLHLLPLSLLLLTFCSTFFIYT